MKTVPLQVVIDGLRRSKPCYGDTYFFEDWLAWNNTVRHLAEALYNNSVFDKGERDDFVVQLTEFPSRR